MTLHLSKMTIGYYFTFLLFGLYYANSIELFDNENSKWLNTNLKNKYFDFSFEQINYNETIFGKSIKVSLSGCVDGENYRICTDKDGTVFYPFIKITLPSIN